MPARTPFSLLLLARRRLPRRLAGLRFAGLLAATLLILAACLPAPKPVPATGLEPPQPTLQQAATATGRPAQAEADANPLDAAALILQKQPGAHRYTIAPVSAETGQPLAGYPPVALGSEAAFGFSRERSEMAYLSYQPDECTTYCLGILNLRTWKPMAAPIPIDTSLMAWVIIPTFKENARQIAVIVNKQHGTVSDVLLADRSQSQVLATTSLSANIFQASYTPEGHLAVYGLRTLRSGEGPEAYLAVLDANELTILWEQALPEIPLYEIIDAQDPGGGRYYEPAVAFSPDGGRLYLVAADQPLLVTVDLQSRMIQTARIRPKASWFERWLASTARPVYAKTLNGTRKMGALSSDGRYLYVLGEETQEVQNAQGGFEMERNPLGLQVIDARSGELVQTLDTTAYSLALSPDGTALLLHGWQEQPGGKAQDWTDVVSLDTWEVTGRLHGTARPSHLLDGSLAWLAAGADPVQRGQMVLYHPDQPGTPIQVSGSSSGDWILIP